MSKLNLPYITLDGEPFQVVVIDDDIVLQGLHYDKEITNGWRALLVECEETLKYQERRGWQSMTDREIVNNMANEWLYEYVQRNHKMAVIVQHNVN